MGHFCYCRSCDVMLLFTSVCLLMSCGRLLGKGSWLSFVMSNYDVVTFPLVTWVRCGA